MITSNHYTAHDPPYDIILLERTHSGIKATYSGVESFPSWRASSTAVCTFETRFGNFLCGVFNSDRPVLQPHSLSLSILRVARAGAQVGSRSRVPRLATWRASRAAWRTELKGFSVEFLQHINQASYLQTHRHERHERGARGARGTTRGETQREASNATAGMDEHVADESGGPYFPFNRRETYPPRLKVDFRRLPVSGLCEVDVARVVLLFNMHVVLSDAHGDSQAATSTSPLLLSCASRHREKLRGSGSAPSALSSKGETNIES